MPPPASPVHDAPASDSSIAMLSAADGARIMVRWLCPDILSANTVLCGRACSFRLIGALRCNAYALRIFLLQAKLELMDRKINTLQASMAAYAAHE